MARRVCLQERVWIEVLSGEGLGDAEQKGVVVAD